MMMPNMAKNAMTMRKEKELRSREPQVPFLLRFFEAPELLTFFADSFEYIFLRSNCFLSLLSLGLPSWVRGARTELLEDYL